MRMLPVDVALVQGGVATGRDIGNVASLGSVFYEPLVIVYRNFPTADSAAFRA